MPICVVGTTIFNFEILKLFFNKFVLDFSLFLLQQYICGIDLIIELHQLLFPFFVDSTVFLWTKE